MGFTIGAQMVTSYMYNQKQNYTKMKLVKVDSYPKSIEKFKFILVRSCITLHGSRRKNQYK